MERLNLPEPARSLWLRTRDTLETALDGLDAAAGGWRLGGGTILAARWGHRHSTDIDLTVNERTVLRELSPQWNLEFEDTMRALGGEPKFQSNEYSIRFDAGRLHMAALEPTPKRGQSEAAIEGRSVIVLSNAQILCGKLQRVEYSPVRDAFDFITAKRVDPHALLIAANTESADFAAAIAASWELANSRFESEAAAGLHGVPPRFRRDTSRLGFEAAEALRGACYERLAVYAENGRGVVEAKARNGMEWTVEMRPAEIDGAFEANGLNHYLNKNQLGSAKIRNQMKQVCRQTTARYLLWDAAQGLPPYWSTAGAS